MKIKKIFAAALTVIMMFSVMGSVTLSAATGGIDSSLVTKLSSRKDYRAIYNLQLLLNYLNFPCGPVDGIWGTKTETAVKNFQSSVGLSKDGKVGRNTITALVQKAIKSKFAWDVGPIDGLWGDKTSNAVFKFQTTMNNMGSNINNDRIVGDWTWDMLCNYPYCYFHNIDL